MAETETISAAPDAEAPAVPHRKHGVVRGLIKTIRPHQWVKNLFVLAPMFFAQGRLPLATPAGPRAQPHASPSAPSSRPLVFSLLAGAVYTINDLVDVEADRVHPVKREPPDRQRSRCPRASRAQGDGRRARRRSLSVGILGRLALRRSSRSSTSSRTSPTSFWLKKVAFLDVGLIAFGFVLRVLAGGFATDVARQLVHDRVHRAARALPRLRQAPARARSSETAGKQRAALEAYSKPSLNVALGATGLATAATYVAYTFDPTTCEFFHYDWLWLTAPFTVFGIVRFLLLVSGRAGRGREPSRPRRRCCGTCPSS